MKYYVVDAFTDQLFSGNPAGVCLLESEISSEQMQNIAAENNLAETAFLLKQGREYWLRWFTPEQEFDLCGHATLASAYVLFRFVETAVTTLTFTTMSGVLQVSRQGEWLEMDFPARPPKQIPVTDLMQKSVSKPIREAYLSRDMILLLPTETDVATAEIQLHLVATIPNCANLVITAKGNNVDFVSRFFTPGIRIPEDPVTGSAHSSLIPFWAQRLGKPKMIARQLSQRGGTLHCQDQGDRVKISGQAVLYLVGEIFL